MFRAFLILLCCGFATATQAATLRVERDGSGDYAIIQNAVDAAASGDTILIGPGRYDEGQIVTTAGWTENVRILIQQEELTLIGAGPDLTIIGPESPYDNASQGDDRGIIAGPYFNSFQVWVSGIGFENMGRGIMGSAAPIFNVDNCRFSGLGSGVTCTLASNLSVSNCSFDIEATGWGHLIYTNSMNHVEVWNCDFSLDENGENFQVAVQFDTTMNVNIHDCTFNEGKYGLQFSGASGSVAEVSNCQFLGQSITGLIIVGLTAEVNSCYFENQAIAIRTEATMTDVVIQNTIIQDVDLWSIQIYFVGALSVHNSFLAHGPQYTVYESSYCSEKDNPYLGVLDMTNNDWATTDPDSIASWNHLCHYDVDYIPFIGQSVPTTTVGWGDLKAQFR